jgi:hypothetical protein
MPRVIIAAACLLVSLGTSARAQFRFVGPGSTPQGDYLRGVGIAAYGIGIGNMYNAQATAINTNTWMTLNEYLYESITHENQVNAQHRHAILVKNKEAYDAVRKRISERPETRDVTRGDALNAVLKQMNDPRIHESTSRSVDVALSVDEVRRIPFKLGSKGVQRFSIARLTAKGSTKEPIAFQDHRFDWERKQFEHSLDEVLEQQYRKAVQKQSIDALALTVDNLERRLDQVFGPSQETRYIEGKNRLKEMRKTVEMLKFTAIERALGELDRYGGTTVNDLRMFMLKHQLEFADAENPDEIALYPDLYAKLLAHKDRVTTGLAIHEDDPK